MRRPIVTRYEPDPALSWERRLALGDAFAALRTEATIYRDSGLREIARIRADDCRALVSAFGVRRPVRTEISVARQEEILAARRALAGT